MKKIFLELKLPGNVKRVEKSLNLKFQKVSKTFYLKDFETQEKLIWLGQFVHWTMLDTSDSINSDSLNILGLLTDISTIRRDVVQLQDLRLTLNQKNSYQKTCTFCLMSIPHDKVNEWAMMHTKTPKVVLKVLRIEKRR